MKTIYLDYAATTPTHEKVLRHFVKVSKQFIANPNSGHNGGIAAALAIDKALNSMRRLLKLPKRYMLTPTSGSSESNNLALKGVAYSPEAKGKHIIISAFEHSSTTASANFLARQGFDIAVAPNDEFGRLDIAKLEAMIRKDTILISICSINPEIGIRQPIEEIKTMLKRHRQVLFHVDATQSIGKDTLDYDGIDLVSLTAHKFFGLKGIGLLIKDKRVKLTPLIHGGHATTIDRRGTPATELIMSMGYALKMALKYQDDNYETVKNINAYVRERLTSFKNIVIHSRPDDLPHILNFSIPGKKSKATVQYFSNKGIEISNHTACESSDDLSQGVLALTGDRQLAETSIRISFSHLTTIEEVDRFMEVLREYCS